MDDRGVEADPAQGFLRSFYFRKGDYAANLALLRRHRERYARVVDLEFALDELPQRFAEFAYGRLLKPLLAFG